MTFAARDRARHLDRLRSEPFDLVVIGGGITGAGVALDAATRGLKTALLERADFASGTSSRSSKLVHGGLRYLDQRDFRLVYEALAERQVLLRLAPHLVQVQPFLFPVLASGTRRSRTFAPAIGTALWLYDLTGGVRIGKLHRRISAEEALRRFPDLDPGRLAAAYLYYDARADDARLTLAVVKTAAAVGAVVTNHAEATGFRKIGSRIDGVVFRDVLADADGVVAAHVVVNAGGVWADEVRRLDEGRDPATLRPAKGVHVTVPAASLRLDTAAVLPIPDDARSVFVVPWGDHVYIGTTDTDYHGSLDDPVCTPGEVEYLLDAVNAWVRRPLSPADVTATWAGLRPLVRDAESERTADLSRRHAVIAGGSGLVTITGGKLTTYRRMATDAVNAAFDVLGRRAPRSPTKSIPLYGCAGTEELRAPDAAARLGVTPPVLEHLVSRYGGQARAVALLVRRDPALSEPLVAGLPYLRGEAVYSVRHEMALTLEDVLARRTRALALDCGATAAAAPGVAELLAPELGWTSDEARRQVDALIELAGRVAAR